MNPRRFVITAGFMGLWLRYISDYDLRGIEEFEAAYHDG
jgi:hypothetical protein